MHRFPRLLLRSLAVVVPVVGLSVVAIPGAGAATGPAPSHRAQAVAIARTAIRHLAIGQHATDHRVNGQVAKVKALSQVQSTNWSGYADTGSGFTQVSGNWTEPGAHCTSTTSLAAFWVGIDGYSSNSVEQDGTLIEYYLGAAYYFSWWEMYPSNAVQIVGQSVAAADRISASVVRTGTTYALTVTDSTNPANSFTTDQSCSCANTSAEWIAEAPSGSAGIYPLSNFGTWTLTSADVAAGGATGVISSYADDEITMIDNSRNVKAQPGSLNGSGNSFADTWRRST
jgi:Peptidase A4 family